MISIFIGIIIVLFGAFLYWAYLPDYKRNPTEFWKVLIGMPIGILLGGIGFTEINKWIKKWALKETNKKNNTKK